MIEPTLRVLDLWPLLLVGFGLSLAVRRRGLGGVLVGLAVALLGAGMLAERLGYVVAGMAHLWPLVIVAAGLGLIWNGLTHRPAPRLENENVSADELQRSVTMGGLAVAVDSQQFRGGALSATMGEVKVDLRRAAMSGEEVTLDLSVVMGGIELVRAEQLAGGERRLTASWARSRTRPSPGPTATGYRRGSALARTFTMGAVTIKN